MPRSISWFSLLVLCIGLLFAPIGVSAQGGQWLLPGTYDHNHAYITYSGAWQTASNASLYGGSQAYIDVNGASISIPIRCDWVQIGFSANSQRASLEVYQVVSGQTSYLTTINQYNANSYFQFVSSKISTVQFSTLQLVVTGAIPANKFASFDFIVCGSNSVEPTLIPTSTNTPTPYPNSTLPPFQVTQFSPDTGSYYSDCPSASIIGLGTVEPDDVWLLRCGRCIKQTYNPFPSLTPNPTDPYIEPTYTPAPGTPTVTPFVIPTMTPMSTPVYVECNSLDPAGYPTLTDLGSSVAGDISGSYSCSQYSTHQVICTFDGTLSAWGEMSITYRLARGDTRSNRLHFQYQLDGANQTSIYTSGLVPFSIPLYDPTCYWRDCKFYDDYVDWSTSPGEGVGGGYIQSFVENVTGIPQTFTLSIIASTIPLTGQECNSQAYDASYCGIVNGYDPLQTTPTPKPDSYSVFTDFPIDGDPTKIKVVIPIVGRFCLPRLQMDWVNLLSNFPDIFILSALRTQIIGAGGGVWNYGICFHQYALDPRVLGFDIPLSFVIALALFMGGVRQFTSGASLRSYLE